MLGAAFVIVTMAIGTLFSLAVFLRPLEESMGWARSSVSAVAFMNWIAMGMGSIGMGLGSYAGGIIHDLLGSYLWLFLGSGLLATMAILLGASLRPSRAAVGHVMPVAFLR